MNYIIRQIVKWQLKKYKRGTIHNFYDWCCNSFNNGEEIFEEYETVAETKGKITYNDIPYNEVVSLYNYVLPKNRKSCGCVPSNESFHHQQWFNWCEDNDVCFGSGAAGVIHYIMKLEKEIEQLKNI